MADKKISITINGKKIKGLIGRTVLETASEKGINIPALCFHPDLDIKANCRMCLVEIKGRRGLQTACSTQIEEGMEIITESAEIKKARKINLELIFAQHREECADCVWSFNCQLLKLAREYGVKITRFPDRKTGEPVYQFGPSLIFDSSKCIDCRNCVDVCKKQGIGFLEIDEKKPFFHIVPTKNPRKDCVYCGQCIVHCPAGAFEAVGEFEEIEEPLRDKKKTVVVQFAPSIRSSIGEEFNIPYGSVLTDKLASGIRKLGFDKVFDVCVGADVTTIEEAGELMERLKSGKNLPMFTSCCPAWVKFVEFYYPEFIPNLTTVRSPHIILGGLIKTFWAQKEHIDPKDIVVVSIMPCVSKKYEIRRKELSGRGGINPVDYVLTTRELAYLFSRHKVDLKNISPCKADAPLGVPSGAGVIYGATGGVMESALRTAYEKITGKALLKLEFKQVRGKEGIKKAVVKIGAKKVRVAVVNGLGNARLLLEEIKKNPKSYDYVEVMACFGGCIGGGGQPLPVDDKIRQKRAAGLYQIDSRKKVRLAHENPVIKELYRQFFSDKDNIHRICHTKYARKKKENKF